MLLLSYANLFSQDIIKKYDEFENKFYLSLKDDFDLTIEDKTETLDFDMNILKVYDNKDTSYFIKLSIENIQKWSCSGIESKCRIKYNDKTITLRISNYNMGKSWHIDVYRFEIPITKNELLKLFDATKIEIDYLCEEGSMKGTFNKDEISELRSFLQKYVN